MSISYGIKPDWPVVLRTKRNVQQLAYQLHVVEQVYSYVDEPQDYFKMSDADTDKVAKQILPILMGDTWDKEKGRHMTDEEARNVGYVFYPLGHHN